MNSPNSIQVYIQQHNAVRDNLLQLHHILESTGLEGQIELGEPVYSINGKTILGFRVIEEDIYLWFKNMLDDEEFLNLALHENKGFQQLRFKKDEILNEVLIKAHISAAIERIEHEKAFPKELRKEIDAFKNSTNNTHEKRVKYGDFLVKSIKDHTRILLPKKNILKIKKGKV